MSIYPPMSHVSHYNWRPPLLIPSYPLSQIRVLCPFLLPTTYMEGGSHGDVYLCTAVIFREPYLYGGDILHTCPQREGIIAHKAGGNMGPLQIQNRVYNIHDSWRLYPRNTMDRRKIEYNGKDNIRGISPLPEDTKDDGKHLKKLLVVSFHVQLAVWIQ